jgi:iron(III) transport system substrate-binding protein
MSPLKILRLFTLLLLATGGCSKVPEKKTVIVYTSVDDVFARPVAEAFENQTGIEVKLVPDTEETKSTGLLNRLIAEKQRPQADVFWSGDPVRAAILKAKGVSTCYRPPDPADTNGSFSDQEGHWSALSARARVILVNTNLVPESDRPNSIKALADPKWKGKACIANPLFGTTSMHAAALFSVWGDTEAKAFFDSMAANGVVMLSSNGEVKRRVAAGDFAFGLTDTDDASVAVNEGKPVVVVFPDSEGIGTLLVPNAAVLIANSPNPDNGKRFIDYLMTREVEQALAECEAAQMPLREGVAVPPGVKKLGDITPMKVDYAALGGVLDVLSKGYLKDWVDRQRNP